MRKEKPFLEYAKIVRKHRINAISEILTRLAERGDCNASPHAVSITFNTDDSRVKMPAHLHRMYPKAMQIILEHQYYGLKVENNTVHVSLSFQSVKYPFSFPVSCITLLEDKPNDVEIAMIPGDDEEEEKRLPEVEQRENIITVNFNKR